MTKTEIFASFTKEQRQEFDKDIEYLIQRAGIEYDFDSTKVAEVNTNMRLKGEVYLNVTLVFHCDKNGHVTGNIEKLVKFDKLDEYLDSINRSNADTKGKKLK
jgi:hypothetical protein